MTKEQQRIAIAEAAPKAVGLSSSGAWMWSDAPGVWHCCYPDNCPLNDLNAMREAENSLTCNQHLTFRKHLWDLIIAHYPDDTWDRQYISAKAAQRAESFLRTLNLWKT